MSSLASYDPTLKSNMLSQIIFYKLIRYLTIQASVSCMACVTPAKLLGVARVVLVTRLVPQALISKLNRHGLLPPGQMRSLSVLWIPESTITIQTWQQTRGATRVELAAVRQEHTAS